MDMYYVNTKHRQVAAALPWSSLYRARQPERYCARVVHKVNLLLIFVLALFSLLLSRQFLLFHFPHQSLIWKFTLPESRVFASFPHLVRIDLSDTCIDDRAFDTIGSHCKGLQVKTRRRDVTLNYCNFSPTWGRLNHDKAGLGDFPLNSNRQRPPVHQPGSKRRAQVIFSFLKKLYHGKKTHS